MSHKAFWTFVWIFTLVSMATLVAQQPTSQVISFTGYIPDFTEKSADLIFRIYPEAKGEDPVFEETQKNVPVADGTFSARIGDGTDGGIPPAIFASNPSLWIAFAFDDKEIGDRMPITGNGYAFKAVNADNAGSLGGVPASGFIQATGGRMSGSSSTSTLGVTNSGSGAAITATSSNGAAITATSSNGAGITATSSSSSEAGGLFMNAVGDFIQGKRSVSESPRFRIFNTGGAFFGNTVGIGTMPSQAAMLEVKTIGGSSTAIRFGDPAGFGQLIAGSDSVLITTSDGVERLRIKQGTGLIGIGTTNPTTALEVRSRNGSAAITFGEDSGVA